MPDLIQIRRDTLANWTAINPRLHEGEIGIDLTVMQFKLGDGVQNWLSLPYYGIAGNANLAAIAASTFAANSLILLTGPGAVTIGGLTNAYVDNAAAIAWSKIDKTGAVATDVGAFGGSVTVGYLPKATAPGVFGNSQIQTVGLLTVINGTARITTTANLGSASSRFAVFDGSNNLYYRSASETRSDISAQALNANLTAIAGLTFAANSLILLTGPASASVGTLTNIYIDAFAAIDWTKISKFGASLADLPTRNYNDLLNIPPNFTPTAHGLNSIYHTGIVSVSGNFMAADVNGLPVDSGYNSSSFLSSLGSVPWASITGKPTTISGYGITDAYTKTQLYTKTEMQTSGLSQLHWNNLTSVPSYFNPAAHHLSHEESASDEVRIIELYNNAMSSLALKCITGTTPTVALYKDNSLNVGGGWFGQSYGITFVCGPTIAKSASSIWMQYHYAGASNVQNDVTLTVNNQVSIFTQYGLTVGGSGSISTARLCSIDTANPQLYLGYDGSNYCTFTTTSVGDLLIASSTSGYVGIGTVAPTYKLDVMKLQNAATIVNCCNDDTGTATRAGFRAGSGSNQVFLYAHATTYGGSGMYGPGLAVLASDTANGMSIVTHGGDLYLGSGDYQRMKVTGGSAANTKIGINTNSPTGKLTIYSDVAVDSLHFTNTTTGELITDGSMIGLDAESLVFWNQEATTSVSTFIFKHNISTLMTLTYAGINLLSSTPTYRINSVQVVSARKTGWTATTGTLSRAGFDPASVTLLTLAQNVSALLTDLTTHGLIGP
jgi:hypothetical protein